MLHFPAGTISIRTERVIALQESEIIKLFLYQVCKAHKYIILYLILKSVFEKMTQEIFYKNEKRFTSVPISIRHLYHHQVQHTTISMRSCHR